MATSADRPSSSVSPAAAAPASPAIPPRAVFLGAALLCAAGAALVRFLARAPRPADVSVASLLAAGVVCLALAFLHRPGARGVRRAVQTVGLVLTGLLCAGPGWFFGPHAAFGGLVALLLLLAGVLSGGPGGPVSGLSAWLFYGATAGGQAVLAGLVLAGTLPDESLTRVVIAGHPMWHHVLSQVALQGVYLAAFLSGRSFQRRYGALAEEVAETLRVAARRGALVDEARAEYRRALEAGRHGVSPAGSPARSAVSTSRATEPRPAGRSDLVAQRPDGAVDLASILRERPRPLEAGDLRRLVECLGRDLAALHAAGDAHLDVAPRHVLRTADPDGRACWRLAAPGAGHLELARAPGPLVADVLRCLPPERLRGAYADARADVYGMAAVVYAAVAGRMPFDGVEAGLLPSAVLERMPAAPPAGDAASAALATVLRVGLAKRPEDRPTAADLAAALLDALDGRLDPAFASRAERLAPWEPPPSGGSVPAVSSFGPTGPGGEAASSLPPADGAAPTSCVPPPRPASASRPPPDSGVSAFSAPRRSSAPAGDSAEDPASSLAWREAYGAKMRGFFAGAVLLCAGGAAILGFIGREPGPVRFAWACMAGVVGAAWLHRRLAARRPGSSVYWPWALAGALSVGPAHSFGIHSAFASVLVLALFSGGVFRATQRASWVDRRGLVLAAVLASHTLLFALILAGVVPDQGNVAVRQAGAPAWEPVVHHLLLLGIYAGAFAAGNVVDRAQQRLADRARAATLEAARRDALLTLARADLDRALAEGDEGVFTGQRVGPWDVGRLLGRGGMGEVYEARHAESGARAALKLIRGDRVGDPVFLRLFERETAALRRVASPYVARVLDVGGLDAELPYIAMEYIEGRSLADILRERDRLSPDELRALVRDGGRGLEDVHAAGVVHGDLKPRNVFRATADARWKLADFGGARFAEAGADESQRLIVGTAAYMSPEQAAGEPIDARSDLFSWCLVLYRAIVGRPAFTWTDPAEAARGLESTGPPDPRASVAISEDLMLALRLGLARRPSDRFAGARETADAFAQALDDRLDERFRRRARDLLRREPWGAATESSRP